MNKAFRNIILIIGLVVVVLLVSFLVYDKFIKELPQTNTTAIDLYYRDQTTFTWGKESCRIKNADMQTMLNDAVLSLRGVPKSARFTASVPDYLDLIDVGVVASDNSKNYIAELFFTDTYNAMTPLEASDCVCSLVQTLTGFSFVDGVRLYVGGEVLPFLNASVLDCSNVVTDISIESVLVKEKATLYFSDESGNGLIAEERDIEHDASLPMETFIIKAMAEGPTGKNLVPLLPKETKVISTKRDDIICFVDLNADFINKLESKTEGGSVTVRLAIASIVNALTDRPGIKRVQILIEGDKIITNNHGFDLTTPFERMESEIIEQ